MIGKTQSPLQKKASRPWLVGLLFLCCSVSAMAQGILITGNVKDSEGETMPGVNVIVKGTTTGTITDIDGNYRIHVPSADAALVFTFIGYGEQSITVDNQRAINVTMSESAIALEGAEVVAVGYGSVRRRDVTGSVASADMAELQKAPVGSVLDALAGRISGVQIISADGTPGQTSGVVIRGGNSITGNNNPLYVVDGFPQVENFDLGIIDPAEIESLNVLKDASSTAIYGSRGANGVVIITTKKGRTGKPAINYTGNFGWQSFTKRMDVMSPYDFVAMELERDPTRTGETYLLNRTLESYRNEPGADWEGKLFRTAATQSHTLSVRGGNETTKYNFTGSYLDQNGVIIESGYKRYNGKVDLEQQLSKWLKGGVSVSYTHHVYAGAQPSVSAGHQMVHYTMFNTWGYMPVSYSASGNAFEDVLIDPDIDPAQDYRVNPIISTRNEHLKKYANILSANAYLDFRITDKVSFKTIGQVYQILEKTETFNNSLTRYGHAYSTRKVNGSILNTEGSNLVNENIVTYADKFAEGHNLTAVGAITFEKYAASRYGYGTEFLPNEIKGMSGLDEGNVYSRTALVDPGTQRMSLLGRVTYDYLSRYLATVSMRADASSMFAKGNRWGYFPSASLAWRFSEEGFFAEQNILSNGKLRASWGWTGNDRINSGDRFQQMLTPENQMYPMGNSWSGVGTLVSYVGYPGNSDLRWEKTMQTNFGIDLGFLNDRIVVVADVYRKNTHDLLLDASLPGSTGYTSIRKNIGQVQNQGLEIMLSTVNIKNKSFEWRTNINISFNQNKVIQLADGQPARLATVRWDQYFNDTPAYIAEVDGQVGQIFGYVWDGVYQSDDFIYGSNGVPTARPGVPVYATNNLPGDIKYRDVNGDGAVNDGDRQVIGSTQPLHQGGINNTFGYRGFDLSVFFRWAYGNDVLNANRLAMEAGDRRATNQFATFVNRWRPDSPSTTMHRLNSNGMRYYSSRIVEDASFLRFQTIALGYSFPKEWLQKVRVGSAKLSVAANNLYTWTDYSGYDPEVSAKHTAMTPGFDYSTYPRARTITFTLNLGF